MLKTFALIDHLWLEPQVKLPLTIGNNYILRNFYESKFAYKELLRQWELSYTHSTGSHTCILEVKKEHEQKDLNSITLSIRNLMSLLRLVTYCRAYFSHTASFENKRIMISQTLEEPRPSSFSSQHKEISMKDITMLRKLILNVNIILNGKNERVLRALHFWDSSSCSLSFEQKTVDLFISLESLFTKGNGGITFKLASRMAWYLENSDADKRIALFNKIKQGYSKRSDIVHGKTFLEGADLPMIQEIHKITRNLLLDILKDKKNLSTFSEEDMEKYFNDLVFGKMKSNDQLIH